MNLHDHATGPAHVFCLGIGAGPANLSLACLMFGRKDMSNLFVDRKPEFTWHDGQQIAGSSLQVSMLKDLVSLSDPTNPFSFLSYLHSMGRVYHFLNARFEAVPRREFRDYMAWVSRRNPNITFGEEVVSVEFDGCFRVRTSHRSLSADNISVAVGNTPWTPPYAGPMSRRSFHISEFMSKGTDLAGLRVAVVGGGQSGAEAFLDLVSRPQKELPRRVSWLSRRSNFLPLDDSPFTNDFYMPDHCEYFAGLPPATRDDFNRRHVLTSDGISESTLRAIYQRIYVHRFLEDAPDLLALYPNREVFALRGDDASGFQLSVRHNHEPRSVEQLDFDVIVWATGFRPAPMPFLAPIAGRIEREGDEYRIDSGYAACWDGPPQHRIFLQNAARAQRGLADPNLSLLAWRSQRILDRLAGTDSRPQLSSFIEWSSKPSLPLEER